MAEASDFKLLHTAGVCQGPLWNHTHTRKLAWPWKRELSNIWGSPLIYLQWHKLATWSLVHSLCLTRSIIKSPLKEKLAWPWARAAPQIVRFPDNISAMDEASDFIIGMQLCFANYVHQKITPSDKKWASRRGSGLMDLQKIWPFVFNISTTIITCIVIAWSGKCATNFEY